MSELLHVGLDVGSTTVKIVVMNDKQETIYTNYTRHFSDTKNTICIKTTHTSLRVTRFNQTCRCRIIVMSRCFAHFNYTSFHIGL